MVWNRIISVHTLLPNNRNQLKQELSGTAVVAIFLNKKEKTWIWD